jgi:hypothetical protein
MIASARATSAAAAGPGAPAGPPPAANASDAFAAMLDDIAAADTASAAESTLPLALVVPGDAKSAIGSGRIPREVPNGSDSHASSSASDSALADEQAANAGLLTLLATLGVAPAAPDRPAVAPQDGAAKDVPLVDDAGGGASGIDRLLGRSIQRDRARRLEAVEGQLAAQPSGAQAADAQAKLGTGASAMDPSGSPPDPTGSLATGNAPPPAALTGDAAQAARMLIHAAASAAPNDSAPGELPAGSPDRFAPQALSPDRPKGGAQTRAVDLPKPLPFAQAPDATPIDSASGRSAGQDSQGSSSSSSSSPWTRPGADAAAQAQARADAATPSFARAMEGHVTALAPALTPHAWPAVSSAAAPAGSTMVPDDMSTQIVQAVNMQWNDGVGEARITLRPDYLGGVSISLHVDQGSVTAVLHADSPAVRTWLQSNEPMLRQGLSEQGLTLERLVIAEQGQTEAGDAPRDESGSRQEQPRRQRQRPDSNESFELIL